MNPVYAIASNTEISYGETFGFLRYKIYILENNSCSKTAPKPEFDASQLTVMGFDTSKNLKTGSFVKMFFIFSKAALFRRQIGSNRKMHNTVTKQKL
jgi:hypothetical protein